MRKKRFIGSKGYRITKNYLVKGMQYWAKYCNELLKKNKQQEIEIKFLKKELNELQERGK